MRRLFMATSLFLIFMLHSTDALFAAVVKVKNSGEVIWNVLPAFDEAGIDAPERLSVTSIAKAQNSSESAEVSLINKSGKVELSVNDRNGSKYADVTNYDSEVVEIEQYDFPKKISISVSGEGFIVKESSVSAFTEFPITVNPDDKRISLTTKTGQQYLSILPSEALRQVIQGQVIDVVDGDLVLNDNVTTGQVEYVIFGKKTFNILNIYRHEIPIAANVSAIDGKVVFVDQPIWLPIVDLLFS